MNTRRRIPGLPDPMHFWTGANGVRIAGDAWGDPNGPLVLMLHGVGQTRHAWGGTGKMLGAAGYHAIALDARGHGDSAWAHDGDYSRDAMIRDLQCVIAAVGQRRPVLIGASMGGITSLLAVGENKVDARALVLVDIAVHVEAAGVDRVNGFMSHYAGGFATLDEVAEAINRYRPRPGRPRNLSGLAKNVRIGADGRYYWHWDPKISDRQRDSIARRTTAAQRITIPIMLVRGERSDVLSEDGVRRFKALCPHSEVVSVSKAGHMVAGDRNDTFGLATDAFLRRVAPVAVDVSPMTKLTD
ncbi:alpha/beta fold hydrolase [Burkholderia pseudomultivorans]|uniref:Alpha/beta hydrolase n=1 Tax=Burkholderia pseudomultivorans TaxID=1207504 RepID=A0A132E7X1_9BURK|nr:alpha/beta hydrolase [Burkholderia pseudomultivorans]KWF20569.1 alpha/beta hydrolase [Burkholderia pseudomultivorans]